MGSRKKHTKNALTDTSHFSPFGMISHVSNKIFLPNKFLGIHLSFKLSMAPPWKISQNSLGCRFQPRSFSSLLPARLLMLSRTKLTSTKTRIEKKPETFPIYPKKKCWTIYCIYISWPSPVSTKLTMWGIGSKPRRIVKQFVATKSYEQRLKNHWLTWTMKFWFMTGILIYIMAS